MDEEENTVHTEDGELRAICQGCILLLGVLPRALATGKSWVPCDSRRSFVQSAQQESLKCGALSSAPTTASCFETR